MDKTDKAVELGTYFEQFISKQVATGRFSSNADVLMAGLRLLEEQQIQMGLNKQEQEQVPVKSLSELDETSRAVTEASQTVSDAMRALASATTEQKNAIPAIPATKGLLRSHIAAE